MVNPSGQREKSEHFTLSLSNLPDNYLWKCLYHSAWIALWLLLHKRLQVRPEDKVIDHIWGSKNHTWMLLHSASGKPLRLHQHIFFFIKEPALPAVSMHLEFWYIFLWNPKTFSSAHLWTTHIWATCFNVFLLYLKANVHLNNFSIFPDIFFL